MARYHVVLVREFDDLMNHATRTITYNTGSAAIQTLPVCDIYELSESEFDSQPGRSRMRRLFDE